MPLEYYDLSILSKIGDAIGKTIKIDNTTGYALRGRYARLCVELDLTKPLIPKVRVGKRWYPVEYEGLGMLCFHCGRFGHSEHGCGIKKGQEEGYSEFFWMIATRRNRRSLNAKSSGDSSGQENVATTAVKNNGSSGSRFTVLEGNAALEEAEEPESFPLNYVQGEAIRGETSKATKGDKGKSNGKLKAQLQATAKVSNKSGKSQGEKGINLETPVRVVSSQPERKVVSKAPDDFDALKEATNLLASRDSTQHMRELSHVAATAEPKSSHQVIPSSIDSSKREGSVGVGINGDARAKVDGLSSDQIANPDEGVVDAMQV